MSFSQVSDREHLLERLRPIIDPELGGSIVELGMVRELEVSGAGEVDVTLALTVAGCPAKSRFEGAIRNALSEAEGVRSVRVHFTEMSQPERQALGVRVGAPELPSGALSGVSSVIAIASGKGGVGKSTLTANLAASLAATGRRVGVIDADVYGFSLPRLLGVSGRPQISPGRKIIPLSGPLGMRVISIGFFLEPGTVVPWRGPMLHKVLQQFIDDVDWGSLDQLLIDLPPGTGDVAMSLTQLLPQAGFVIVTTPNAMAGEVASRAAQMAVQMKRELIGVVENMAGFTDQTGQRQEPFGAGAGAALAATHQVPLLGSVPISLALRDAAEHGGPGVLQSPEDPGSAAIARIAETLARRRAPAVTLPVLKTGSAAEPEPAPGSEAPVPTGMSLPMA